MNAASQVPSGVLISTSASIVASEAPAAGAAVAARPAATERTTKSRRGRSRPAPPFREEVFEELVMLLSSQNDVVVSVPSVDLARSGRRGGRSAKPALGDGGNTT